MHMLCLCVCVCVRYVIFCCCNQHFGSKSSIAMIRNDGSSPTKKLLQEQCAKARALAKQRALQAIRANIEAKGTDEGEHSAKAAKGTDEGEARNSLQHPEVEGKKETATPRTQVKGAPAGSIGIERRFKALWAFYVEKPEKYWQPKKGKSISRSPVQRRPIDRAQRHQRSRTLCKECQRSQRPPFQRGNLCTSGHLLQWQGLLPGRSLPTSQRSRSPGWNCCTSQSKHQRW